MKEGIMLKKGLALFLGIMLLAGCSSQGADEPKPETDDELKVEQNDVETEGTDDATEDQTEAEETEEPEEVEEADEVVAENDDLKDLPEFNVLADKIDLDVYQGNIKTDNKGNRIILFENEKGHKEYKSIFIKHDKRLKIVEIGDDNNDDDEGLIYNEILK